MADIIPSQMKKADSFGYEPLGNDVEENQPLSRAMSGGLKLQDTNAITLKTYII